MLRGVAGWAHRMMLGGMHFGVSVLLVGLWKALRGVMRCVGMMSGGAWEMTTDRIGEGVWRVGGMLGGMRGMVSSVLERNGGRGVVGLVRRYGGERGGMRGGLEMLLMKH